MRKVGRNFDEPRRALAVLALLATLGMISPLAVHAGKKKKAQAETDAKIKAIDYSNIVWPNPPAISRIKYTAWYASEKRAGKAGVDKLEYTIYAPPSQPSLQNGAGKKG